MKVDQFSVTPWSHEAIHLEWSVTPDSSDPNFVYNILRSSSPEGPFDKVEGPIDQSSYLDDNINVFDKWKLYIYKLEIVEANDPSNTLAESESQRVRTRPDPYALEIVRRNKLLLREYISPDVGEEETEKLWNSAPREGGKVSVLKKKEEGERCEECWDPVKYRVTDSDCDNCDGTGFDDGWHDPVQIYMSLGPPPKRQSAESIGDVQQSQTSAWTSNYPIITPEDIIAEPYLNKWWRVVNVNSVEKGRVITRQMMQLKELDPDQPEMDDDLPGYKVFENGS